MIPQSPTSLSTYATCPRQYQAKYITKEVVFADTEATLMGSYVHKLLEDTTNCFFNNGNFPERGTDNLLPIVRTLCKYRGTKGLEVKAETKLAIDKDSNACDWYSKDCYMRAIADAVFTCNGQTLVLDYKTGKYKGEPVPESIQIQAEFLRRCCIPQTFGEPTSILFLYLFAAPNTLARYEFKKGSYDLQTKVDVLMNKLAADTEFLPQRSGLCKKWCDVLRCEFNGRREQNGNSQKES